MASPPPRRRPVGRTPWQGLTLGLPLLLILLAWGRAGAVPGPVSPGVSVQPEPVEPLQPVSPQTAAPAKPTGQSSPEVAVEDFGRWERSTNHCEIRQLNRESLPLMESGCRSARLEQQGPGQLSIRLLPAIATTTAAPRRQLILAGVLTPGSLPMRCRDTRCEPQWPLRVQLSALGSVDIDRGDLPTGLPQTWLVRGDCLLDSAGLSCQASEAEQRWTVEAHW